MARTFDEKPFHPEIPEELRSGEKVARLCDALALIYKELWFQLSALGPENFSEAGLRAIRGDLGPENFSEAGLAELRAALGVPVCFSEIGEGETIASGTLVIWDGVVYRAARDVTKDGAAQPDEGSDDWELAG